MLNLLNSVQGLLTDNMLGKISSIVGSNSSMTKTALSKMLPSILSGVSKLGSTSSGASSLLSILKNNKLGAGTLNNLASSLSGGGATDALMDQGSKINEQLFGNDLKSMVGSTGLDSGSASKLMNLMTPIALGAIGKEVTSKNLDASGLQNMLKSQSFDVAGLQSSLGAAGTKVTSTAAAAKSGGGSIMRWLIPLFFLLAAGWFLTQYLGDKKATDAASTETTTATQPTAATTATKATHTHADGTVHEGASHGSSTTATTTTATTANADAVSAAGLKLDGAGNLVDKNGKIVLKSGEFTIKNGEYFDADGNKLNLLEKIGKAVGDAGKAVGGAVAGAAGKTADAFQDAFGGMFTKKKAGAAVAAYNLSDIVFDTESHKITSFSKNEVMGLASALKATPDAKIKVQVSSADGQDKKVTKMRAQVVHDMLVTLGVSDKQISAEGLGEGDGKVAIVIE